MSTKQITKEQYSDLIKSGFSKNVTCLTCEYSFKSRYIAVSLGEPENYMVEYAQNDINRETEYIEELRNFKSEHLKNNEGFDIEETEKNIKNASTRRSRAKNNMKKRQVIYEKEIQWENIFTKMEKTDQEYEVEI
tara:strand:+ start:90 stop:494 length:405 start_codon:yes stop_codon:yes gene_type:complete